MEKYATIKKELLFWFQYNKRDLPWRKTYAPYDVWISEIMLQQTQMDRVVPFFNRWIEYFPNLEALSKATEEEVLKCWEGLGYYSRARNILKAGKELRTMGFETVPPYEEILKKLPGIGPYTSGAILSIAYNLPYTAVDGNVRRVFSRLFNIESAISKNSSLQKIENFAKDMLAKDTPRDFNQALMELGALICIPKFPRCNECPLQKVCKAFQEGVQHERPVQKKRVRIEKKQATAEVLYYNGSILIRQRDANGPWASLWELPWSFNSENTSKDELLITEINNIINHKLLKFKEIGSVNHTIMNTRIDLCGYFVILPHYIHLDYPYLWVSLQNLQKYTFQAGSRKLLILFLSEKDIIPRIEG